MKKIPSAVIVILCIGLTVVSTILLFSIQELWTETNTIRYTRFEKWMLSLIGVVFSLLGICCAAFGIKNRNI